jgi:hypothetical protein
MRISSDYLMAHERMLTDDLRHTHIRLSTSDYPHPIIHIRYDIYYIIII